jgi:hypothetical protein
MEMNNENMFDDGDSFVFDHDSPDWKHKFYHLITLNIWNGGYSNLNMVLQAMYQMLRVDFGVLLETKITNNMYMQNCCDYTVFASHAKSIRKVAVITQYLLHMPRVNSKVELLSFVKQRIHNGGLKCALISSE